MNTKINLKNIVGSLMITAILLAFSVIGVMASPPGNDNFADATVITGLPFSDSSNTSEATIEENDPSTCAGQLKSIWYRYTPENDASLTILANTDDGYRAYLSIFRAENGGLTPINCGSSTRMSLHLYATAGTTYYFELMAINIGSYPPPDPDGGNITVNIRQSLPPANDDFVNAAVISDVPFSDSVDTTDASSEPGEPVFVGDQRSVWYSFTPGVSGFFIAESSSDNYTFLAAYTGSDLTNLQMIDSKEAFIARVTLTLEAGMTYHYLTFMNNYQNGGPVSFNIKQVFPPANDNFANATIIPAVPYTDSVVAQFANVEPGEPNNCSWVFHKTIWYSFTPSTSGSYTVEASAMDYLTLVIYTGSDFSNLQMVDCRLESAPRIQMTFDAGTTYYFQIFNNYEYFENVIAVSITQDIPPANDNFTNATIITGTPFSDTVATDHATIESGEPWACGWTGHNTIWYSFTPSVSGSYTAESTGGYLPNLAVYTGSDYSNLQPLVCGYTDWSLARTTLFLNAGTTYFYQMYTTDYYGWGMTINFSIYLTPPPEAYFSYWPGDPMPMENIQFSNDSYDPYWMGIQSCTWDFGDGTNSTECYPIHAYASNGNYTVQLTVTTFDGRSASTSQIVQVRTHDVGITRFMVPTSARAGQTKQITVYIKNLYYPETVQVDLYRSTASGYELVGTLTQDVPIRPPNRAQDFTFTYTFTSQDAALGKVVFRAVVTILTARDAYPPDNAMISIATKVTR
jgi:PKD repeat protein